MARTSSSPSRTRKPPTAVGSRASRPANTGGPGIPSNSNSPGAGPPPARGTPGNKPDPYKHPGDEPDIQPDVIAGQSQPPKGASGNRTGERMPGSGEDKQRSGDTAGKRQGGQEDRK